MTMSSPSNVALLAQADLLLAAARLFRPPADDLGGLVDDLAGSADELVRWASLPDMESKALPGIATALAAAVASMPPEMLALEYARLFEAELACAPNEGAYIRRDKGALLGDIAGFYQAFGLVAVTGTGEKPDHIATELEFAAALLIMLARANEAGDGDKAEITRNALFAFASDHMGDWLPSFALHLMERASLPAYRMAGEFLLAVWLGIARAQGFDIPTEPLDGTPDDAGPEMACAMGATSLGA